jgi:hypothetical protein
MGISSFGREDVGGLVEGSVTLSQWAVVGMSQWEDVEFYRADDGGGGPGEGYR